MTRGTEAVRAEVQRQREVEGYTFEHDLEHGFNDFAAAAWAYLFNDPDRWPWDGDLFKPKDRLSNLIRAGALAQVACAIYMREHDFEPEMTTGRLGRIIEEIDQILDRAADVLYADLEREASVAADQDIRNIGFGPHILQPNGKVINIKYVAQPDGTVGWRDLSGGKGN